MTNLELAERYPSPPLRESDASPKEEWAQTEDSWYYYLAEIALRRIADRIVRLLYSGNNPCDFYESNYPIEHLVPAAIEFERQLVSWHESLPEPMAFPISTLPVDSELRYFLRSRYYLISELLHRPFLCYAVHNPERHSPEIFALAEKCLLFAYSYLIQSNHTHRHHGKWLQLRREVASSCLLLAASGSGIKLPDDWYRGIERAHEHLQYWSLELPYLGSWQRTVDSVNDYFGTFRGVALGSGQSQDT